MSTAWHQALTRQPLPPNLIIVLTGVLALAVVAEPHLWRLARNAITIAHEGGHALFAVLSGRKLSAIELHSDASGRTVSTGPLGGRGAVLTLMMGYAMPSLLGLAFAWLLADGRVRAGLWLSTILAAVMLLMIRNAFGALTLLVTGGAMAAVALFASPGVQGGFLSFAAWLLLLGAVRPLFELARHRRRGQAAGSDVDQLETMTEVPAGEWLRWYLAAGIAAVAIGIVLLGVLPRVLPAVAA